MVANHRRILAKGQQIDPTAYFQACPEARDLVESGGVNVSHLSIVIP
jgi:hypothetical protein